MTTLHERYRGVRVEGNGRLSGQRHGARSSRRAWPSRDCCGRDRSGAEEGRHSQLTAFLLLGIYRRRGMLLILRRCLGPGCRSDVSRSGGGTLRIAAHEPGHEQFAAMLLFLVNFHHWLDLVLWQDRGMWHLRGCMKTHGGGEGGSCLQFLLVR